MKKLLSILVIFTLAVAHAQSWSDALSDPFEAPTANGNIVVNQEVTFAGVTISAGVHSIAYSQTATNITETRQSNAGTHGADKALRTSFNQSFAAFPPSSLPATTNDFGALCAAAFGAYITP